MPIYEYACTACGERTEAKQSFADPPLTECPLCGGSLRKLYSPVGIVFKGSGFYSTDAKKKSSTTSATSDQKTTKTDAKTPSTSADGKPEKKSEKKAADASAPSKKTSSTTERSA